MRRLEVSSNLDGSFMNNVRNKNCCYNINRFCFVRDKWAGFHSVSFAWVVTRVYIMEWSVYYGVYIINMEIRIIVGVGGKTHLLSCVEWVDRVFKISRMAYQNHDLKEQLNYGYVKDCVFYCQGMSLKTMYKSKI